MTTLDPRQSIEFEPVAIGSRRRRVDPLAIVVLVLVGGLALSIAKPWGGSVQDGVSPQAVVSLPSSVPVDPATGAAPVAPGPATAGAVVAPVRWSDLSSVVQPHDAWGIRVIVRAPGRTSTGSRTLYQERWVGIDPTGPGGPGVVVLGGARSAVALGLSFPRGHVPLDVRIWSRTAGGTWRWLDARPVARPPAEGGLIFMPPASGFASSTWNAGEYRIDALIDRGTVQRFEVDIPDRYENVRPATAQGSPATELVSAAQLDPTNLPTGLFAAVDRVGVPLGGAEGSPLDESAAWLDTDVGSGRAPRDRVAVAYLPRATGLGVRLPDGATVRSAVLTRLAPDAFPTGPVRIGGGIIDHRPDSPWVLFPAYWGEAWDPGVYRIDVTWVEADGLHRAAWHAELRPGPSAALAPILAMTRAWARYAGRPGIVVGRAEPLEGGPRSSAIRLLGFAAADASCPGTPVDGSPEAFGIAHPPDLHFTVTDVRLLAPTSQRRTIPTVESTDPVPGLTLIAPANGGSFEPGIYRITVQATDGPQTLVLCVGGPRSVRG